MKIKELFSKKSLVIIFALLIIGSSFFLGVFVGAEVRSDVDRVASLSNKEDVTVPVDFAPFWKAWNILKEKHISGTTTPDQTKVWGAIQGLASSFNDPYTTFFPPQEAKVFKSEISGNFEGIGAEIGIRDNLITVISPLKGSPAEKAGMLPGDKIIKIDDKDVIKTSVEDAVKLIRGDKGTKVKITVTRAGVKESIELSVTRDVVDIPTVETKKRSDGIFVISLYSFSATSADLFRKALREFVISKDDKLILDLRGNPGGYLEAAVDMASWFLPSGEVIVSENYGGHHESDFYRSKGYNIFNKNLKFVILVNNGSASASEILSGALQEYGIAKLVGTRTFGKGSVQELVSITPETSLKVTIAKWFTPKGRSISDGGLTPDFEVKMTEEDFKNGKDPQMDKAIEVVKNM
ncbi:MAG: S41 family peptidase [Candidatus Paceibacterota bacterium]